MPVLNYVLTTYCTILPLPRNTIFDPVTLKHKVFSFTNLLLGPKSQLQNVPTNCDVNAFLSKQKKLDEDL